jgi:hypothetical protein
MMSHENTSNNEGSYLGREYSYREADGSGNVNLLSSLVLTFTNVQKECSVATYWRCWFSLCKIRSTKDNAISYAPRTGDTV